MQTGQQRGGSIGQIGEEKVAREDKAAVDEGETEGKEGQGDVPEDFNDSFGRLEEEHYR